MYMYLYFETHNKVPQILSLYPMEITESNIVNITKAILDTNYNIAMWHFASLAPQNKRPKGPHIVHLSTMCHLFGGLARAAILFFRSAQKTQTW